MPDQKLRWVLRNRKGKPMFILQQYTEVYHSVTEGGEGTVMEWVDVPVVDDGKADEQVAQPSWITQKIKEFWAARMKAKAGKQ